MNIPFKINNRFCKIQNKPYDFIYNYKFYSTSDWEQFLGSRWSDIWNNSSESFAPSKFLSLLYTCGIIFKLYGVVWYVWIKYITLKNF